MIPNSVKFLDGQHKGLTFERGIGPGVRKDIGGGITFLVNSTNFWYHSNNRSVSLDYLIDNKDTWVKV